MKEVLIASPIRQKPNILKEFLDSLSELECEGLNISYLFVDDNVDKKSSFLLEQFGANRNVQIIKSENLQLIQTSEYRTNEKSHLWKRDIIEKVANLKNKMIDIARIKKVDFLFLIDSDIVLNKNTLLHLISRDKDIISNIFWTEWVIGGLQYPQVWMQDENSYYNRDWDNDNLSKSEKKKRINDFIITMKIPGLYEVGGLGACTLISKKAINSDISFSILPNISFWGEDRHFCIRASSLGFKLYVDTVYPAYHIYREEYLNRVQEFKDNGYSWDMCKTGKTSNSIIFKVKNKLKKLASKKINIKAIAKKFISWVYKRKRVIKKDNKVVLSMIVHNEENKYLKTILEDAKNYVDDILIIDDASTDNTVQECEDVLKDFPHTIVKNKKSMFFEEYKLREKQWKETIKLNPTWILTLDADEIPEKSFKEKLKVMIKMGQIDVFNFKYYDFWNENQYRSDNLWKAHTTFRPYLVRYQPKIKAKFRKTNQHCGTFPKNIALLNNANVDVKIKHYGWSTEDLRRSKYERYMKLDPEGKFGDMNQYKSIMDKSPNLINFEE